MAACTRWRQSDVPPAIAPRAGDCGHVHGGRHLRICRLPPAACRPPSVARGLAVDSPAPGPGRARRCALGAWGAEVPGVGAFWCGLSFLVVVGGGAGSGGSGVGGCRGGVPMFGRLLRGPRGAGPRAGGAGTVCAACPGGDAARRRGRWLPASADGAGRARPSGGCRLSARADGAWAGPRHVWPQPAVVVVGRAGAGCGPGGRAGVGEVGVFRFGRGLGWVAACRGRAG